MHPTVALGLLSTLLFGLRHGIDYDHIAAITDITSTQRNRKEGAKLTLLYGAGHGAVIFALGTLAVVFGAFLPASLDGIMERFVGATLIVLGVYVTWTLVRSPRGEFQMMGRYHLLLSLLTKFQNRKKSDVATKSTSVYVPRSAFVIGMIHGIGAETPTQLGLFLFAAGVGGKLLGFAGVALFVIGVLITNLLMGLLTARTFESAASNSRRMLVYRGLAGITACYSLVVGAIFLFGSSGILPAL